MKPRMREAIACMNSRVLGARDTRARVIVGARDSRARPVHEAAPQ